ncbi:MAG: hypothetical protein KAT34_15435 [Candidatus Aminicenantes bacterium]|nr:hypothetical protein [Candidatus Aminicenantes bacterium]
MSKNLDEILSILKSIEKIELYTRDYSDPDIFFEANYQKIFNDKIDLLVAISEELEKKDTELKNDLGKNAG